MEWHTLLGQPSASRTSTTTRVPCRYIRRAEVENGGSLAPLLLYSQRAFSFGPFRDWPYHYCVRNLVGCAKSRGEVRQRAQRRHSPSKTGVNALKAILRTRSAVHRAVAHPTKACDVVVLGRRLRGRRRLVRRQNRLKQRAGRFEILLQLRLQPLRIGNCAVVARDGSRLLACQIVDPRRQLIDELLLGLQRRGKIACRNVAGGQGRGRLVEPRLVLAQDGIDAHDALPWS